MVDFVPLFKRTIELLEVDTDTDSEKLAKVIELEKIEKVIFTTSDVSGSFYHRTIHTPARLGFYLKRSFFTDFTIDVDYSEVLKCDVINVRAIKDTDIKVKLAPDGTLIEDIE